MKTNFTHFFNRNTTIARHLILACLVIVGFNSSAQTAGDYRSAPPASGAFHQPGKDIMVLHGLHLHQHPPAVMKP